MSDDFPYMHSRAMLVLKTRAELSYNHVRRVEEAKITHNQKMEALANLVLTLIEAPPLRQLNMRVPHQKIERRLFEEIKASKLTTNEALVMLGELITSAASHAVVEEREAS